MILYLRDEKNRTILDLELYVKTEDDRSFVELASSIDIKNYSLFLLNEKHPLRQSQIIRDFDELSELRGWLWESYFMVKKNTKEEYDNVLEEVRKIIKKVADRHSLYYVED